MGPTVTHLGQPLLGQHLRQEAPTRPGSWAPSPGEGGALACSGNCFAGVVGVVVAGEEARDQVLVRIRPP